MLHIVGPPANYTGSSPIMDNSTIGPLLLSMLLAGCAAQPTPAVRVVTLSPPAVLMRDCARPDVDLGTNATVIDSLLACHARVVSCNVDRAGLRGYIEDAKKRAEEDN